ncbi:MAG: nitrate reductase cytochrome c-type subunit [Zetaproteobacteria bacterium]|nr:nitrate reductase cytochrome c-type subunit [Zetaproteobacteria bacterium]
MKKISIVALLCMFSTMAWAGSDAEHSLRGDVPLDAPSVASHAKEWSVDNGKINRNYPQQPPLVPHDIADFTINQDGNSCLSCHNWNSEMPGATKVGISHFLTRENQALGNVSPRRYFCTQCHVPQKDAKPLVANMFRSLAEE